MYLYTQHPDSRSQILHGPPAHPHNDSLPIPEAYFFWFTISDSLLLLEAQLYSSTYSDILLPAEAHVAEAHLYYPHTVHILMFEAYISTITDSPLRPEALLALFSVHILVF